MAEQDDEGRLSNENGGSLSASKALHLLRLTLNSVYVYPNYTRMTGRIAGNGC